MEGGGGASVGTPAPTTPGSPEFTAQMAALRPLAAAHSTVAADRRNARHLAQQAQDRFDSAANAWYQALTIAKRADLDRKIAGAEGALSMVRATWTAAAQAEATQSRKEAAILVTSTLDELARAESARDTADGGEEALRRALQAAGATSKMLQRLLPAGDLELFGVPTPAPGEPAVVPSGGGEGDGAGGAGGEGTPGGAPGIVARNLGGEFSNQALFTEEQVRDIATAAAKAAVSQLTGPSPTKGATADGGQSADGGLAAAQRALGIIHPAGVRPAAQMPGNDGGASIAQLWLASLSGSVRCAWCVAES